MMPFFRLSTFCAFVLWMATAVLAGEQPAAKKKGKKAKKTPEAAVFKLPAGVELSTEQQTKFDELKTQYAPKLAEAQKKVADVYTEDQKAAQQEARKKAAAAGKKGKELKAAVESAVQLTDDQKQTLATAEAELNQVSKEIRNEIIGLLTNDQRKLVKGKLKKQA